MREINYVSGGEVGKEKISCGTRKVGGSRRKIEERITVPVNGGEEVLGGSGSRGSRGYHALLGRPVR